VPQFNSQKFWPRSTARRRLSLSRGLCAIYIWHHGRARL